MLKKETGATPVRARRRDARIFVFSCSIPQIEDKPLSFILEKAKKPVLKSKYFLSKNLCYRLRVPTLEIIELKENKIMKKTRFLKTLSFFLCIVLIAAMALFTIGCNDKNTETDKTQTSSVSQEANSPTVLGTGATKFLFSVIDADGKETKFEINTDKKTVGDALLELKLIDGEPGAYGLYVKTVNGTTLDYDKDGKYWAFYVNSAYANSGVDTTNISENETYSFKAEKA